MDLLTILGIVASIVTVLAFIYMLIFGQRGLIDWLERRRPKKPAPGLPTPPALLNRLRPN